MKKKYKLKKFVMPTIYIVIVLVFVITSFYAFMSDSPVSNVKEDIKYVSEEINNNDIPVVADSSVLKVPYNNSEVEISNYFYDFKADESEQQKSIHMYENTYIQNSGIDYISKEPFEVLSAYGGTVIKVEENDIVGKFVEIKHDNNVITVYQGLSEINVKENDNVSQSQVIGKSGKSKIVSSSDNHLHFEVYINGIVTNPLNCIGKRLDELQ